MAETATPIRKGATVRVLYHLYRGQKAVVLHREGIAYEIRLQSGITRWVNDTQIVEDRA